MSYDFKFGELWLSEFRGVTTTKPDRDMAEYDYSKKSAPGMDGFDYIDNHRYKEVSFIRKIGFGHQRNGRIEHICDRIIEWLSYSQGLQDFEDTLHPDLVTQATLDNFKEIKAAFHDRFYTADLKFTRQPFWYLKDSLKYIELDISEQSPSILLRNPYRIWSEPIIYVQFRQGDTSPASLSYSITTGGVTTPYSYTDIPVDNSYRLFIDCEAQEVRSGAASSNNLKFLDLPLPKGFMVGDTTLTLSGDLSRVGSVAVMPRWRCL